MALRTFRDADGADWQVWSVVPGLRQENERRRGTDRRSPEPVLLYAGDERRREERRLRLTRLGAGLECGWLTFESGSRKRRLSPIPVCWERGSERDLQQLCERAHPVGKVSAT
ncbi:MAG TPA: hypothetical protein VFE05_18020 [Longimicrobiaceae bacterium]|jgi:hypothetical protein|nr:hypothetical protein [Longimicrobiaceae bacterium]